MQMHTLLFTHIYFIYECMYVGGCFLPLCSPLRSIPVCPVLGHGEHVFSVTLATTAINGYHMDFLNIGAITNCTEKAGGGWFLLWSFSSAWAGSSAQIQPVHMASRKHQGWRGRHHTANIITDSQKSSSIQKGSESGAKLWSFHLTSSDPFGEGSFCSFLTPLSAKQLSLHHLCCPMAVRHHTAATPCWAGGAGGRSGQRGNTAPLHIGAVYNDFCCWWRMFGSAC